MMNGTRIARIARMSLYDHRGNHKVQRLKFKEQCASRKERQAAPLMGRAYLSVRATRGAVEPSHIGEGRVRVDVSFASFLCAKEKSEEEVFFAPKKRVNKGYSLRQRKE